MRFFVPDLHHLAGYRLLPLDFILTTYFVPPPARAAHGWSG
ncbi:hypothetical protein AtDm6_2174 [Acetobacter tropicalis]|uniref:Uncharacterized protein n=2 Tax=Acetobacter tropicalis TaxID=104102 RepID=F7VAK4_9PROT|nr:hypothetical protein AtDm6_2174 [Acetobacter tropicalis]GAA07399.1 hypothetical protein ATPR_0403 [Acetobacter tropicalis NBRC 101654]